MPPLIVAALIGAGAYAGFRIVQHLVERVTGPGGAMPAAAPREKDLGRLELDPSTGVYRPTPPTH
jgi:hypothetical protein